MREKASDNVLPIGSGRWNYTKEDFLTGTKPYEELFALKDDPFRQAQTVNAMADYAKSVGVGNSKFTEMYKAYTKSMKGERISYGNVAKFTDQPMELNTGSWEANDYGVFKDMDVACQHPIMPVGILTNLDTKMEKLRIAFRRGNYERWREIIVDRSTVASRQKIVGLADHGIFVNSDTASALSRYLTETADRNYDDLPKEKSISRLGHIPGEGFSPYVEGLIFDGEDDFRDLYLSIRPHGKLEEWISIAKECRKKSVTAKIALAASFASPLLNVLGVLPFVVHIWGATGGGKTVALMLAASVWGDPSMGKMVSSFLSTAVGLELRAAFLNHLPLCLDEFQLVKNKWKNGDDNVYLLTEGAGKSRGKKGGGLQKVPTWKNTILTTGESPIYESSAGGGAMNRIIGIECKSGEAVITDGQHVADTVKANYGLAGRKFVEYIYADVEGQVDKLRKIYKTYFRDLLENGITEKQAMAAAAILVADAVITLPLQFFDNEDILTVDEILPFLLTNQEVSVGQRGYDWILEWIAINQNRFDDDTTRAKDTVNNQEVFGRFTGTETYIIRAKLDKALDEAGFQPNAVYSWMRDNGKIKPKVDKAGKFVSLADNRRIRGRQANCIVLTEPFRLHDQEEDMEELDF